MLLFAQFHALAFVEKLFFSSAQVISFYQRVIWNKKTHATQTQQVAVLLAHSVVIWGVTLLLIWKVVKDTWLCLDKGRLLYLS